MADQNDKNKDTPRPSQKSSPSSKPELPGEKAKTSPSELSGGPFGASRPGAAASPASGASADPQSRQRDVEESVEALRAELDALSAADGFSSVRSWTAENPALAVFSAAAVGILTGRFLSLLTRPFRPDPLPVRARKRTQELSAQAQARLSETREEAARRSEEAAERIRAASKKAAAGAAVLGAAAAERTREATERARAAGEAASAQAKEVGETASARAKEIGAAASVQAKALSETAVARAQETSAKAQQQTQELKAKTRAQAEKARAQAQEAGAKARERAAEIGSAVAATGLGAAALEKAHDAQDSAQRLSASAKKKVRHGRDIWGIVRNAAKTALTAAIIKKLSDVVRKVT